jgi:prophage DNA circulation protein
LTWIVASTPLGTDMAWRDQLIQGSYRRAKFLWERADAEVGRKTARHDYPGRDECLIEDLGKAPQEFTLDVFVLGPNYMAARDDLIDAVEAPGVGLLNHPTWGMLQVCVSGKVRISESTREGGLCRFTIPFTLVLEDSRPRIWEDTADKINQAADVAAAISVTSCARKLTLLEKILAMIVKIAAVVATLQALMAPPLIPKFVTSLINAVRNLSLGITGLLRTPFSIVSELRSLISSLSSITDYPRAAINAYRGLFDFGSDDPAIPLTTATRCAEAASAAALNNLVRQTAVIEACRLTAAVNFTSYQDAVTLRDELTGRLDDIMLTADDDLYLALQALRSALVRHVGATAADLARLVAWTPKSSLPALVIAHLIYLDATQSDEIVSRNRIRHPGFVPGGQPLEVLTP